MLLLRTPVVLYAIFLAGRDPVLRYSVGSHEHPASAFSWRLRQVGALFAHLDCGIVPLSYCQFGAPYRKHTKLGFIYASFLSQVERVCHGDREHIQLRGALTTLASQYPPGLCSEFASAIAYARRIAGPHPVEDPDCSARRGSLESMVFNDVLLPAPWKSISRASCTGPKGRRLHINLIEVRAHLIHRCAGF